jgi:2-amino-4-hydroxy-6-hydroxymethyldihydropteridine diphosphokinase
MPSFINIVIKIETVLAPLELLKICNFIESKLGRTRSKKNDPRTCDIDIIDYDKKILNIGSNKLIIPHPQMTKRNFVLLPLFDLDRGWIHPESKIGIVKLINSLPIKDLRSIKQI